MRIEEAAVFLHSFKNERVRDFVKRMLLHHYVESVLEHHPDTLPKAQVFSKCDYLTGEVFAQIMEIKDQPEMVNDLLYRLSRKNPKRASIWFEEFDRAYENYKHNKKLFIQLNKMKPFLKGDSFCDIGCGGGDLVHFVKNNHPQFKEYAGIDVMDWRTEELKDSINFQMLDLSRPGTSSLRKYDTLTCIAVLHHVGDTDESVCVFLQNLKNAISTRGRLIIEEDVILPASEIESDAYYKVQVEERMKDQPLFSEFIQFSNADQKDTFILIDLFANALSGGVLDMAFPFGFRTINQWSELFLGAGFEVEDVRIMGFQKGLFNRSSHVYFILKPG